MALPEGTFSFDRDVRIPFGSRFTIDPRATFTGAGKLNVDGGVYGQIMPIWSEDYMSKTYGASFEGRYPNIFSLYRAIVSNQTMPAVAVMGNAIGGADGTANTHVWGGNFAAGAESPGSMAIAAEMDFGVHNTSLANSIGIQVGTNSYVDNLNGIFIRFEGSPQGRTGHGLVFDGSTGGAQIYYDLVKSYGMMHPLQGIDFSLSRFANYEINTPSFAVTGTRGVSFVGTLTAGSTSVTAITKAGLLATGGILRGAGIPDGTTITVVDTTNNALTLSQAATASGTGVALSAPLPLTQVQITGGGPENSPTVALAPFGASTKTIDSLTVSSLGAGYMRMQTGDGATKATLSSNGGVDIGQGNAVAGSQSAAIGAQHALGGPNNTALGYGASDRGYAGKVAISNGYFATRGDAQAGVHVLRGSGNTANAIRLTTNGVAAGATNCVNIPDYTVYGLRILLTVRDASVSANTYTWSLPVGTLSRGNGIGTMALGLGTPASVGSGAYGSTPPTVAVATDTTNGCLNISVTPPAGNTDILHVVAKVETAEVQ